MRHQHKPNVQSIPAGGEAWSHYRALTPPAIVLCEWEMVLVFDPRSVYRERRTARARMGGQREKEREGGGRSGCGPCLEARGWLCWFTACQH